MKSETHGNLDKPVTKRCSLFIARKILLRLSRKRMCSGIEVACLFARDEMAFEKIRAALDLIFRYAPHRFNRIRREVKVIWVFAANPYSAEWQGDISACVLDHDYMHLEKTSPEEIAITIMHEATHARIQLAGIDYEENVRPRIERLCVRSELWLARRLPNADELIAANESKLSIFHDLCVDGSLLSDHAFREREIESLREFGHNENWFVRFLAYTAAWIVSNRSNRLSNRSKPKE